MSATIKVNSEFGMSNSSIAEPTSLCASEQLQQDHYDQIADEYEAHYSDATVNLHERMYGIRNGEVEEVLRLQG